MKKQAMNPYLPNYEYIPDAEPYVFGDRVYIYGSHDRFGGDAFCMNDYVCWSAPVTDLADWRYEGVIYRKTQDPRCKEDSCMYAPDVTIGPDGRYYLYYTLDFEGSMAVAVADTPVGPYAYYGRVKDAGGHVLGDRDGDVYQYDPGVLVDDDGRIWLYVGFAAKPALREKLLAQRNWIMDGAYCMELEPDMLTVKTPPKRILPWENNSEGTGFEDHAFFEASSPRKIGDVYYFVYSSQQLHELCYATSRYPDRGFTYGGTLVSNGDVGLHGWTGEKSANYFNNNHGGLVCVEGQWYIFYHRHTNYTSYSRQTCAEKLTLHKDGSFSQAELTSCGLNEGDLRGIGTYPASIACWLYAPGGACSNRYLKDTKEQHPCITQETPDDALVESQYIFNLQEGDTAVCKYFDLSATGQITLELRGSAGAVTVTDGSKTLAKVETSGSDSWESYTAKLVDGTCHSALFFRFETRGKMHFRSFTLQ